MPLAPLISRLSSASVNDKLVIRRARRVPTAEDWIEARPVLERLYVRERQRLRFIIRYMKDEFDLQAT